MKDKPKGIRKRVAAVLMSVFMVFSKVNANVLKSAPNSNYLPSKNELNIEDNLDIISNNYEDVKKAFGSMIPIEDILQTDVNGEICDTMVPQGLAIVDDLMIISAYDGINDYKTELKLHSYNSKYREKLEKEKDHKVHNSVLYIYDMKTKRQMITLELPDVNHVGGIVADGENLYIAKGTDREISIISLDKIKEATDKARENGVTSEKLEYDSSIECDNSASFITMRTNSEGKKQLCVGTWAILKNFSKMRIYDIDKDESGKINLSLDQEIPIQVYANGAEFVQKDGTEYLIVGCSCGRSLDSRVYINRIDEDKLGKLSMETISYAKLPPMTEEISKFTDESGKQKIAIGSEAFSRRYEIGKQSVIPNGVMIADVDEFLEIENKLPRDDAFDILLPEDMMEMFKKKKEKEEDKER